jgi:uncharacterized membrane protein YphA (DoxX/SURF4 family)
VKTQAPAWLVALLRAGLGAVLVLAGALKVRDPAAFALEITNFQLLPALAPYLAVILPTTEILTGLALFVGTRPWRQAGAVAALGLFGLFTAAVVHAVTRGINVDCGCFGSSSGPVTPLTIARNVGLLLATGALLALDRSSPRPAPFSGPRTSGPGAR